MSLTGVVSYFGFFFFFLLWLLSITYWHYVYWLFHLQTFVGWINEEKLLYPAGIGIKWQTYTLIRLHKRMHLGFFFFLSYPVAQAGQRFVLEREKVTITGLDCACQCLGGTLCAYKDLFSFIFLVFGALWNLAKSSLQLHKWGYCFWPSGDLHSLGKEQNVVLVDVWQREGSRR